VDIALVEVNFEVYWSVGARNHQNISSPQDRSERDLVGGVFACLTSTFLEQILDEKRGSHERTHDMAPKYLS
jgi:hypothetical protein